MKPTNPITSAAHALATAEADLETRATAQRAAAAALESADPDNGAAWAAADAAARRTAAAAERAAGRVDAARAALGDAERAHARDTLATQLSLCHRAAFFDTIAGEVSTVAQVLAVPPVAELDLDVSDDEIHEALLAEGRRRIDAVLARREIRRAVQAQHQAVRAVRAACELLGEPVPPEAVEVLEADVDVLCRIEALGLAHPDDVRAVEAMVRTLVTLPAVTGPARTVDGFIEIARRAVLLGDGRDALASVLADLRTDADRERDAHNAAALARGQAAATAQAREMFATRERGNLGMAF